MRRHSRSIYGCGHPPPEFRRPRDCRLTYNPETKRVYVHVFTWPPQHLHLDGFAGRVGYAQLLNDASEIPFTSSDPEDGTRTVTLSLPARKPEVTVPVIELFLK